MSDLTIRDIAKIAGVSTTAVSFVLNNRPGVSDATRQHVQEVIARTGFTPNVHTRRLNLGRSFSVHVVLYWHEHDLFNQFALEILHGVFADDSQVIDYQHKPQFTPNLQHRLDSALETFWQALHRRDVPVPVIHSPRGVAHV